jgi:hypothetical protein
MNLRILPELTMYRYSAGWFHREAAASLPVSALDNTVHHHNIFSNLGGFLAMGRRHCKRAMNSSLYMSLNRPNFSGIPLWPAGFSAMSMH